jgi:spermidine synthase
VKTVNEISIRNLNHLVQVLRESRNEFDVITYWGKGGETMVFPRKKMLEATDDILTDNGIRSQGSQQILTVWGAKKGH